ncbi:MAG: hypothetical protein ACTHJW_24770 [Streptosporangiaceae bacterium]
MNTTTPVSQSHPFSRSLSRRLVVTAGLLFTGGVSIGWLHYLHRSAIPLRYVPGSSAWWQHAVVAVVATAILGTIWLARRTGRIRGPLLLAPLGRRAAHRISLLYHQALRRPVSFCRALLATPLLLLFIFGIFRAGYQITSGLDPNNTVNAWGGPTYIGAMACHYLDIFVVMVGCAWLLHLLMPRSGHTPGSPASACESVPAVVPASRA